MIRNRNGFTLIETLVVLTVILLLITFSMTNFPSKDNQIIEQFFTTLEQDIFSMQQLTVTRQKVYSLLFNPNDHYYIIYDSIVNPVHVRREYDPNIQVTFISMDNPIRFQYSGSPRSSGTIHVTYKGQKYEIVFPLGKGRFYVSEL